MDNYLGEIRLFAGTFAPLNWHLCNGALLPIAENDALFALIGTTYGGDGVNSFQLPDLRGRVPVSKGTGTSGTNYPLGVMLGTEQVTLTQNTMPTHTHAMRVSTEQGDTNAPSNNYIAVGASTGYKAASPGDTVALNPQTIAPSQGGGAHPNMMPFLSINYIIALAGIFPSQN